MNSIRKFGRLSNRSLLGLAAIALVAMESGCASRQSPETFDLNAYLQKQEGLQMYAGETLRTLQEEAKTGDVESQAKLGVYYFIGYGTKPDFAKSLEMLQSAAAKGNSRAQFCLGMIYWKGKGVEPNPSEAYRYLSQASKGVGQDSEMARVFGETLKRSLTAEQLQSLETEGNVNLLPDQK